MSTLSDQFNDFSASIRWLIILGIGALFLWWFFSHTPRVLVIQSYHLGYPWTADMDEGLRAVLDKTDYEVRWEFMDTKRNPSKEYIEASGIEMRGIVDEFDPDVLILLDDNAQAHIGQHYVGQSGIDVVFAGVNAPAAKYGYDEAENVTGMLERLQYTQLKGILFHLLPPDRRRLFLLSDRSPSSSNTNKEIKSMHWEPLDFVDSVEAKTFEEWQEAVEKAEDVADIIVVTQYSTIRRDDVNNRVMEPREVIQWTLRNSKLPAIGFFGFFVDDGGLMAAGPSPYEHGEEAARMAQRIIDKGMRGGRIPITTNQDYVMYMRNEKNIMKHRLNGLDLPVIYDAYALANM